MTNVSAPEPAPETVISAYELKVREVARIVGGDLARANQIVSIAANAISKTPALADCDKGRLWLAVKEVAALNLPIGSRGAYLVPYKADVSVIISPQGFIELAYRSDVVMDVQARVVHANDDFEIEYGATPHIAHRPAFTHAAGRGAMIGAYAVVRLRTGGIIIEYMTRDEIMAVKAVSKAANHGPWQTWESEMWRKTALKRAMKYVPKTEDVGRALDIDNDDTDFALGRPTTATEPQGAIAPRGTEGLKDRLAKIEAPPRSREPGEEG